MKNYQELLNRFWRLDEECQFTTAETRMYMQLLDMFSRVGFDRRVSMCNALAIGMFGISLNAYKHARQKLIDRGLIAVEYRREGRRRCAVFTLVDEMPKPSHITEPESESEPEPVAISSEVPVGEPDAVEATVAPVQPCASEKVGTSRVRPVMRGGRTVAMRIRRRGSGGVGIKQKRNVSQHLASFKPLS